MECTSEAVRNFLKSGLPDSKMDEFFSLLKKVKKYGYLKLYNKQELIKMYRGCLYPANKSIVDEMQLLYEDKKDERKERAI